MQNTRKRGQQDGHDAAWGCGVGPTGMPGSSPQPHDAAARKAWGIVADGYDAALKTPGLCDEERALFLRQRSRALALARRGPLAPAPSRRRSLGVLTA
jgi:hypothetical protein